LGLWCESLLSTGGVVHLLCVNDILVSIFNDDLIFVYVLNVESGIIRIHILVFSKEKRRVVGDNIDFEAHRVGRWQSWILRGRLRKCIT